MLNRLIGAVFRAAVVIFIIALPAFILPNTTLNARELSLIAGGVVAAFTIFEYAAKSPGFVDFRFAPPYNRMRVAIIATELLLIAFYFRDLTLGGPMVEFGAKFAFLAEMPGSPVRMTLEMFADTLTPGQLSRLGVVMSLAMVTAIGLSVVFAALLWLSRWPVDRAGFNLWVNMPNFEPSEVGKTERRLYRDGMLNIIFAPLVLYAAPYVLPLASNTLGSNLLREPQSVIWLATLWAFVPASLIIRGAAILKINRILRQAKQL
ncbi:hypothetical protein LGT41_0003820 [Abyssibius alkaniclasticus]|uniref:hypothetical protein n=1 Tax=Abyssibius alkaniclasticus TaxID=2881234 RepID=UPI0023641665|nr:hypothetical protein [Abyssibius alkaniclasticus]UPH71958.1 hypothetical protein LGT41_0003820 [Abyssibius alkaniclasticus]